MYSPGALAQLARALQWHCRGHRFDSDMLHTFLFRRYILFMHKWLLDEQLPLLLVYWLKKDGSEALHANDLPLADRTTDYHIASWAQMHDYIVVSRDIDFIDLYFRKGVPKRLLFLDVGNMTKHRLIEIFERHYVRIKTLITEKEWLIMDENQVRSYW